MKMIFRIAGLLVCSFVGIALAEPAIANIVVNPISVEIQGDAEGSSLPFNLSVTTFGPNTIQAYLVEVHQSRNGDMGFERLGPKDPDIATVKFDKAEQMVLRPGKLSVSGVIHLTNNLMRHKRFLGIYVVENPPKESAGHNGQILRVRVAYLLPIHTPRIEKDSALRGVFKYTGLTKKNGLIIVNGAFFNGAADITSVSSEVTVRDAHNRLVERLKMNSSANAKDVETRVYPRTEVDLFGASAKITKPGVYNFSFLGKMNKKKPIVVSRKMMVTPEMLDNSHFDVTPTAIQLAYHMGQRYSQKFDIINPQDREIIAVFSDGKVGGNGLTEAKWIEKEIVLPPKSSTPNSFSVLAQDDKRFAPNGVKITFKDKQSGQVLQVTPVAVTFVEPTKSK